MKQKRTIFLAAVLWCGILYQAFALPGWVESLGTETPFSERLHITGFALQERSGPDSEVLEAAKTAALDDLIRKVRVHVKSSVTTETIDDQEASSSSIAIVSQSISNLKLAEVDFLIEKDYRYYYALAQVNKDDLKRYYLDKGKDLLHRIISERRLAAEQEQAGHIGPALETYAGMLPLFPELMECRSVYTVVADMKSDTNYCKSIGSDQYSTLSAITQIENEVQSRIEALQKGPAPTLSAALDKIAGLLASQGVKKDEMTVPAFLYKNTDFSSEFGSYAGKQLETLLAHRLPPGGPKAVIKGTYWETGDHIELYSIAQAVESGKQIGAAFASFPAAEVPQDFSLKPANFQQAMEDQLQFAQGAITDGGLSVEVWTNKGKNEENLVFTEGDELQLYFRVNQPAFLQLTYNLATGEKVLLEKSFYIGMDTVNRVVKLPYQFEVVPPLGVERLIVTAFSDEPPQPNTQITSIQGERYEVFSDTKAVVAQTRGLRKKQKESGEQTVKVGEAMVTLTTVPR
jgi:hypothetical protein